jgi:predicted chitinase
LDQQRAAEGAGKTEKGTGPNAKSESNPSMLSRAWKSLTTNADGSKNWLGRAADTVSQTYDKVTTAVGNAYESAKTTIAGSKVGKAISASAKVIKEKLLAALKAAGISSPTEVAMFMSQMDVESGGFKALSENLNYKPDRLASVFPKYFRGAADAAQVAAGGPEAIANRVYGGRMGNTDPGDGYRYRGRGVIQLTGKANYERYGKLIGVDLVNNPDLAADPDIAAKIAIAYWKDRNVSGPAQQGDVRAVTYKINGGQNGLADRQAKYQEYLSQAKLGQLGGGEQLTSNDAGAKGPGGAPAPGAAPPGAAAGSTGNNGLDAGALPKAGAAPSGGAGTMPQTAFDQVQGPGKPALPTPSAAPAAAGAGAAAKQTDPFSAPDLGPSAAMGTGFSPAAARQATDLGSTRQAQQKAQQDAMGGVVDVLTASHGVQVNMLAALQTIAKAVTDGAALQAKSANDNSSSNADAVRNARQASKIPTPMAQNLVSVAKPVFTA